MHENIADVFMLWLLILLWCLLPSAWGYGCHARPSGGEILIQLPHRENTNSLLANADATHDKAMLMPTKSASMLTPTAFDELALHYVSSKSQPFDCSVGKGNCWISWSPERSAWCLAQGRPCTSALVPRMHSRTTSVGAVSVTTPMTAGSSTKPTTTSPTTTTTAIAATATTTVIVATGTKTITTELSALPPSYTTTATIGTATTTTRSETSASTIEAIAATTAAISTGSLLTTTASTVECRTQATSEDSSWSTEIAPAGSICVFGADPRDEGSHCIVDESSTVSFGWCYTNSNGSQWGNCDENCPLIGPLREIGARLDDAKDELEKLAHEYQQ